MYQSGYTSSASSFDPISKKRTPNLVIQKRETHVLASGEPHLHIFLPDSCQDLRDTDL